MFNANFAEFADGIFSETKDDEISTLKKELVSAFENEEYIPLSTDCFFKASKTEDDGIMLKFAESSSAANEKQMYLSKDDAVIFFDEVVALKSGLFTKVNLEDKTNATDIKMSVSNSGMCEIIIFVGDKIAVKVSGNKLIFEKIIFYLLYSKYYKR